MTYLNHDISQLNNEIDSKDQIIKLFFLLVLCKLLLIFLLYFIIFFSLNFILDFS